MTVKEFYKQQLLMIEKLDLPPVGSTNKLYNVDLTEAEINTIHSALGFIRAACGAAGINNYWKHYGPTLEGLSDKLEKFDD